MERRFNQLFLVIGLIMAFGFGVFEKPVHGQNPPTTLTPADFARWRTELRNWGRWGPNDQKGTANLITPEKVRAAVGPHAGQVAGYFADTIPFFKERDISFAGHDFNIDWNPRPGWGPEQGIVGNPIHEALLVWLGAGIVENLDLEQVAETARRLNRYEFMMTFSPLPVEGGSGSPINPMAIF